MELSIIKGNIEYLKPCVRILEESVLGQKYFTDSDNRYIGEKLLREGFEKGEIYVALDDSSTCIGFAWIIINGIFHWFPFLHVLAVRKEKRGQGVGTALMRYFEEVGFIKDNSNKLFLCVDDFSTEAIKLYKSLGYVEVGPIPDLYVPGVTTYLMMKTRTQQDLLQN